MSITKFFPKMKNSILTLSFTTLFTVILSQPAYSNPQGGVVAQGNAAISQQGNTVQINQSSQQAVINWNSFNIAAGEHTRFVQPNASSVALNRINPAQGVSQIFGTLSANGRIILVNSAGIHFGPNAMVNVGGIIASTANISDANFMAGNYIFDQASPYDASIINEGKIIAAQNGLIALIGNNVENHGLIQATLGNVVLASGGTFTLDFYGDQLINFTVDSQAPSDSNNKVTNTGTLLADGGKINVSAKSAQNVLDSAIYMGGIAQANAVSEKNGVIILEAEGNIVFAGSLVASGNKGGYVKILGNNIEFTSTASINVSGNLGGGEILIGGNYQGKGPEKNAKNTFIAKGALLNADALTSGDGGKIIVWSDGNTKFSGSASAKGVNGNGGLIETSGHYLDVSDAQIDLRASNGKTGTWLLDPTDLTISNAASSNILTPSANVYEGNSAQTSSNLNITTLVSALNSANVQVLTAAGGAGAGSGHITVTNNVSWTSANTLTLNAFGHINVNANLSNTVGGSLVLRADNSGTGTGTINFGGGTVTVTGGGSTTLYYNPTVFGTQNASIATGVNTPNASNFTVTGTFSPYMLVNNLNQLQNITNNSNQYYALGTNIDASGAPALNGGAGFASMNFSGNFSGNNNSINSFSSTTGGIFNINTGTIANVVVNNASLTLTNVLPANDKGFGILVNTNQGTVNNSQVTNFAMVFNYTVPFGTYDIDPAIGGIVGFNSGAINNTIASGTLDITITPGGGFLTSWGAYGFTAGKLSGGTIDTARASGTITYTGDHSTDPFFSNSGDPRIGLLVGSLENVVGNTVTNGYAIGNIILNEYRGKGSIGIGFGLLQQGTIDKTIAVGNITLNNTQRTDTYAGIFAGSGETPSISNSYSIGNIFVNSPAGGNNSFSPFMGERIYSNPTLLNVYASGSVTGPSGSGISAFGSATNVTGAFYDRDALGFTSNGLGTPGCVNGTCAGLANLSLASTFTSAGWNLTTTWGIIQNRSLPYLRVFYPSPDVVSGTTAPNLTVQLAVNGTNLTNGFSSNGTPSLGLITAHSNGYFYFLENSTVIANNDYVVAQLTNGATGAAYTYGTANNYITGINLLQNGFSIGDAAGRNYNLGTELTLRQAYFASYYTIDATNLFLANGLGIGSATGANLTINRVIQGPTLGSSIGKVDFKGTILLALNANTFNSGANDMTFASIFSNAANPGLTLTGTGNKTITGDVELYDTFTVINGDFTFGGESVYVEGNQIYNTNRVIVTSEDEVEFAGFSLQFPEIISVATPYIDIYSFGGNIYLNGNITTPESNITFQADSSAVIIGSGTIGNVPTSMAYAVDVAGFELSGGQWFQAANTLPSFTVKNDFNISTGGGPFNGDFSGKFTRLNTTSGLNGIEDLFGLQGLATLNLGASYVLLNNIDANVTNTWSGGRGFYPIATSVAFSGILNGANFTIDGLYQAMPQGAVLQLVLLELIRVQCKI